MKEAIIEIWQYMDKLFNSNSYSTFKVLSMADELGISAEHMDRVFSAWACTLSPEPPEHLFRN